MAHRAIMRLAALLSASLATASVVAALPQSQSTYEAYNYTNAAGTRLYKLYTPASLVNSHPPAPLVVVLHGCTQSADIIAADSEYNGLADKEGFLVAYPQQGADIIASTCWQWWLPEHQARGTGEPSIIAGITQQIQMMRPVDKRRTYVIGLSAGGAMTVIMGATYPDVYAAIGVASGLEYKVATNFTFANALLTTTGVPGPDPNTQAQLAYQAMGPYARPVPTIIYHGTADVVVPFFHGLEVAQQTVGTNALAAHDSELDYANPSGNTTGTVPNGYPYYQTQWTGRRPEETVVFYAVEGMDHRWSGGAAPGVNGTDIYTDPKGVSATETSWAFFKRFKNTDRNNA